MEATGQSSKIDSPRELELLVVTTAKQGGVDDVVLDFGQGAVGGKEVTLAVIAEAERRRRWAKKRWESCQT